MSKMTNSIALIFAIELTLYLFPGTGYSATPVFDWLLGGSGLWANAPFMSWFTSTIAVVGAAGIFIGSLLTKYDWVLRATIVTSVITFGSVIIQLFMFMQSIPFAETGVRVAMSAIVIAPLALYFAMSMIDFISGRG